MKKCPQCEGTGELSDFVIPLWDRCGSKTIKFGKVITDRNDNDEVYANGKEFGDFIRRHANGRFYDGLKDGMG